RGAGRLRRRPRGARPPARALSRAGPHGRRCPRLCSHPRDDRCGLHDALLRPPFLRRRRGGAGLRGSTHRRRRRGCRRRAAPGGGAPSPRGAHAARPGSLPRGDPQCAPRRGGAGARHEPMARRLIARDVVADGIRIHVVEAGEGRALILLHGLTATHFSWEHTIPAFADRWRVIAPDLPGHGRSEKPDAPYTIDFYAGVIRSLARALDVDEALVVGNSLGGQIAVELGLGYPRFTRALVLAAPAGGYATGMRAVGWAIEGLAGPRTLRVALPRALDFCFHDPRQPACVARRSLLLERLAHEDYPRFARAVSRSLRGAPAAGRQRAARPGPPAWTRSPPRSSSGRSRPSATRWRRT